MIIDASVAVQWATPEPGTRDALIIRDAYAAGAVHLMAPGLFVAEMANVIWKKTRLRRELTEAEGRDAFSLLCAGLPELVPEAPLAPQAFELALAYGCTAYDGLYVSLAIREASPFVTADGRLRSLLQPTLGTLIVSPQQAGRDLMT